MKIYIMCFRLYWSSLVSCSGTQTICIFLCLGRIDGVMWCPGCEAWLTQGSLKASSIPSPDTSQRLYCSVEWSVLTDCLGNGPRAFCPFLGVTEWLQSKRIRAAHHMGCHMVIVPYLILTKFSTLSYQILSRSFNCVCIFLLGCCVYLFLFAKSHAVRMP